MLRRFACLVGVEYRADEGNSAADYYRSLVEHVDWAHSLVRPWRWLYVEGHFIRCRDNWSFGAGDVVALASYTADRPTESRSARLVLISHG